MKCWECRSQISAAFGVSRWQLQLASPFHPSDRLNLPQGWWLHHFKSAFHLPHFILLVQWQLFVKWYISVQIGMTSILWLNPLYFARIDGDLPFSIANPLLCSLMNDLVQFECHSQCLYLQLSWFIHQDEKIDWFVHYQWKAAHWKWFPQEDLF